MPSKNGFYDDSVEMGNFGGNNYDNQERVSGAGGVEEGLLGRRKLRESNWVQRITFGLAALMFGMLIIVIAVASATYDRVIKFETKVITVYNSIGLPGFEGYSWEDVLSGAAGQKMNWWTYNDDAADGTPGVYNSWIDNWLIPRMADLYDITVVRHPLADTVDAVNRVINEYNMGMSTSNGSVDMIWINGENFATLKNLGYAYGPWANKVPNAVNFNFSSSQIAYDFGLRTQGFEMPYNEAQFIFIYNNNTVRSSSINTISNLISWIKATPGKFTYAAPCSDATCSNYDYTGSAFIRHVFYYTASPYTQFLGDFNEGLYEGVAPSFFSLLRGLEPYLYVNQSYYGLNHNYPAAHDDVEELFTRSLTDVTFSYDVGRVTNQIAIGTWPSSTQSLVLQSGTIGNTNFVLIPANAKNKLAAVVTGNFIASAQAMFSRAQPEVIGALQAYNPSSPNFVQYGWNDAFDYINIPSTTPSISTLQKYAMGELSSTYINRIQQDWYLCVMTYSSGTSPTYCG